MSCLSRLLGAVLVLICAVVPGLFFLALSVMLFPRWSELGYPTGPFYSLVSFITGAVCLALGLGILFGRDRAEEPAPLAELSPATPVAPAPVQPVQPAPVEPPREPMPAPLPEPMPAPLPEPAPDVTAPPAPAQTVLVKPTDAPAEATPTKVAIATPAQRIRQLAATRPGWQVTAPQLAQLTNLNMNVADATAREMVGQGEAQMQTGPNGETIYIFDLASQNG